MSQNHHPRGYLRHAAATVSPTAAVAARIALERDADTRVRRLVAAAGDATRERLRPTRPRMRALVAAPRGRLAWRTVPAPGSPGPLGAVVHPIAVATCDLDRALALGETPFALPLHFGHECVAEVLSVGEQVATVRPGDRVVVPFQISCGACGPCRTGRTANCSTVPPISMYGFGVGGGHWGGALSDQLAVPFADAMLVPVPHGIEPAAAASVADNVADAYRHIGPHLPRLVDRGEAASVLIIGALRKRSVYSASIPLYTGLIARALGAREVRVVDARPEVRAHAERLGLTALPASDLRGCTPAPLVVDASATRAGLRAALSATAPDGTCTSSGNLHRTTRFPTLLVYGRNVAFHIGRTHARAVIPAVLDLIVRHGLEPERVTTTLAPLDDAPAALRAHVQGDAIKTVLVE